MEVEEILSKLKYYTGSFPYEAVQEAIIQKEEITPYLLEILEYANENIRYIEEHPDYMAHLYAMFLLAQCREKRAYPLITHLFSQPGVDYDAIAGDFVTEDLPRVIASVCQNDITLVQQIIEQKEVDEWIRGSFLHALLILVAHGDRTREEIMDYFKSLFQGKLERTPSEVWNSLIVCSCRLYPKEVYEDIKQAYEEHLVKSMFISLHDVHKYMESNYGQLFIEMQSRVHYSLVEDTIESMEWWDCFQTEEQKKEKLKQIKKQMNAYGKKTQRKKMKIGRNEACPCGSGKKYKKCCGAIVKPLNKF